LYFASKQHILIASHFLESTVQLPLKILQQELLALHMLHLLVINIELAFDFLLKASNLEQLILFVLLILHLLKKHIH